MGETLAAADAIVSRAGATSLAEISALAIPALLVPYPFATADHQTTNARAWVESGAAFMMPDDELGSDEFKAKLFALIDDASVRESMVAAARAQKTGEAAAALADVVVGVASGALMLYNSGIATRTKGEATCNSEQEQLHFIGVGGVGMSGIARVAHDQGMAVSGSDIKESRYTKQLRDAGVTVFIGQDGANIPDGDVTVVVSTAILENNPELIEARRRNLPIVHRAQMLARLGRDLDTLAVAGTHGKTTTSSMLASTLDAMGYDPTFLIGGIVRAYGTNAHSGRGRSYVVEADESDKSFTYLSPAAAIVTNIEADHLDHYEGLDEIYAQFAAFLSGVREDGPIVVCGDDPKLAEVARGTGRAVTTYGFSEDCDARILATEAQGVGTRFTLRLPDGRVVASRIKQNPGLHNVSNGAAVLTLISLLGLDVDAGGREAAGVRRRSPPFRPYRRGRRE